MLCNPRFLKEGTKSTLTLGGLTWEPQSALTITKMANDYWCMESVCQATQDGGVHPLIQVCADEPRKHPSIQHSSRLWHEGCNVTSFRKRGIHNITKMFAFSQSHLALCRH